MVMIQFHAIERTWWKDITVFIYLIARISAMFLELQCRRKYSITIVALKHDQVSLFKNNREHYMGGTSRSSRAKAKQKSTPTQPQSKRRRVQANEIEKDDNVMCDEDVPSGGDAENEQQAEEIRGDLSDCRKGLEQLLLKVSELEAKVEILDKRVIELQLDRSESSGGFEVLNRRKRSGCSNEKDSLFKEAYESANGKLKVFSQQCVMNLIDILLFS